MSRLTKRDTNALRAILYEARRGLAYLDRPETHVAIARKEATTTLDYVRPTIEPDPFPNEPRALVSVDKKIGSDLVGLREAERRLSAFIAARGFDR